MWARYLQVLTGLDHGRHLQTYQCGINLCYLSDPQSRDMDVIWAHLKWGIWMFHHRPPHIRICFFKEIILLYNFYKLLRMKSKKVKIFRYEIRTQEFDLSPSRSLRNEYWIPQIHRWGKKTASSRALHEFGELSISWLCWLGTICVRIHLN